MGLISEEKNRDYKNNLKTKNQYYSQISLLDYT